MPKKFCISIWFLRIGPSRRFRFLLVSWRTDKPGFFLVIQVLFVDFTHCSCNIDSLKRPILCKAFLHLAIFWAPPAGGRGPMGCVLPRRPLHTLCSHLSWGWPCLPMGAVHTWASHLPTNGAGRHLATWPRHLPGQ